MTVTAVALRELHRLYRQLNDLRGRLDRGPKQIAARKANVTRLEQVHEDTKQGCQETKMASDRKQVDLKSGEAKINDLDAKLNSCKTNKEYQTLKDQIAAAKMANSVLEDEILEGLDEITEEEVKVADAKKDVATAKQELTKVEHDVNSHAESLRADVARLEGELEAAEAGLPAEFRTDYDRIVKKRGEDALAPLDGEHCGGCYQAMRPNQLNLLKMGKTVDCNGCGRYIYEPE